MTRNIFQIFRILVSKLWELALLEIIWKFEFIFIYVYTATWVRFKPTEMSIEVWGKIFILWCFHKINIRIWFLRRKITFFFISDVTSINTNHILIWRTNISILDTERRIVVCDPTNIQCWCDFSKVSSVE